MTIMILHRNTWLTGFYVKHDLNVFTKKREVGALAMTFFMRHGNGCN